MVCLPEKSYVSKVASRRLDKNGFKSMIFGRSFPKFRIGLHIDTTENVHLIFRSSLAAQWDNLRLRII